VAQGHVLSRRMSHHAQTTVRSQRLFIRVWPVRFEFEVQQFIWVWQLDSSNERPECCRLSPANVGYQIQTCLLNRSINTGP
jgi:hypothetical protein